MKFVLLSFTFILSVYAGDTAKFVDLNQYAGRWYVITSIPKFYTKKCVGQFADYTLLKDGTLSLKNTCIRKGGRTNFMEGVGTVINIKTNAEIEVDFDNWFTKLFGLKGDYNIIKIDPDYNFVIVGDKKKKNLWIMAREREMPEDTLKAYVKFAKDLGFPTKELKKAKYFDD